MGFRKGFLWGGAVAAHQLEGGYDKGKKGLSIMDVTTGGDVNTKRRVTDGILPGENYPNHEAIDFYGHYREDIRLFAEMGFKCFRTSNCRVPLPVPVRLHLYRKKRHRCCWHKTLPGGQ